MSICDVVEEKFTISRDDFLSKIEESIKEQRLESLHYRRYLATWPQAHGKRNNFVPSHAQAYDLFNAKHVLEIRSIVTLVSG
jgi:hypothetical protein